jgi:hypothetical protein
MKKMIEIDPVWASKRTWASIFMIVAIAAQYFGYEFDADLQDQSAGMVTDAITYVSGAVGAILGIWSKVKESKK